jgi:hypothetical protein
MTDSNYSAGNITVLKGLEAAGHVHRHDADAIPDFDAFMSFPRKKLPADFDEKKELMEALNERFDRPN